MGGVNIFNFELKAQAVCLAGIASVLDSPDDSSFFPCKYFVGQVSFFVNILLVSSYPFCTLVVSFCTITPLPVLVFLPLFCFLS